jgi:phosphatidate cytidylyltransferase
LALRVLTALVGIPILLSAIWWGAPWLTIIVVLAALLGIRELYRLYPTSDYPSNGPGLPLPLGALWVAALALGGQAASELTDFLLISLGISLGGAFMALLSLIAFYRGQHLPQATAYLMGGPVYVGFLLAHALVLRDIGEAGSDLGRNWLMAALLVTFATDSGAFLVGRSLGRRSLAPSISPSKTWEGAAGGFLFAVAAALALGQLLDLGLSRWQTALISATVGVVSQLGDLVESRLKRISNVKDAGNIVPGHGGILDRLDSLLLSIPVTYYLVDVVFRP